MKIKSQFKDYYDYVQHLYQGGDPKITYDRRRIGELKNLGCVSYHPDVIVTVDSMPNLICEYKLVRPSTFGDLDIDADWLIICGKPFPLINLTGYDPTYELIDPVKHQRLITKKQCTPWLTEFTKVGVEDENLVKLSRVVGHPVFIIKKYRQNRNKTYKVTVEGNCPILDQIGVASIYPAEQIYQDLSYFIMNRMKESPDMAPPSKMTDKEKIQQHGFDVKQSFRHRK